MKTTIFIYYKEEKIQFRILYSLINMFIIISVSKLTFTQTYKFAVQMKIYVLENQL